MSVKVPLKILRQEMEEFEYEEELLDEEQMGEILNLLRIVDNLVDEMKDWPEEYRQIHTWAGALENLE